jgi:ATP-dependent Clp protease adaptor protein ClpS
VVTKVATKKSKPILKKPKNFEVILLNDDYTTMEFVVEVLKHFFKKDTLAAEVIMLKIHTEGEAVCGAYPYDIAQSKVSQVIEYSRKNEQPLMCVLSELNS